MENQLLPSAVKSRLMYTCTCCSCCSPVTTLCCGVSEACTLLNAALFKALMLNSNIAGRIFITAGCMQFNGFQLTSSRSVQIARRISSHLTSCRPIVSAVKRPSSPWLWLTSQDGAVTYFVLTVAATANWVASRRTQCRGNAVRWDVIKWHGRSAVGGVVCLCVGPRLFLPCPMNARAACVWFTDLWNYSIIPYIIDALRDTAQVHCHSTRTLWYVCYRPSESLCCRPC